jgi:hypothetical protein
MTDLRTRIAAIVVSVIGDSLGSGTELGLDVADAVIAELGMREQTGNNAAYPQVIPCADYLRTHHRYVTDWKADDETD